jgi:uncharacterized membrane protein
MNQSSERNNFNGNVEESGNNQAGSNTNQDASDFGEVARTFNGAVTGAMIGAPFGLIGTVIGGVTGGAIGKQIVEGANVDDKIASKNRDSRHFTKMYLC